MYFAPTFVFLRRTERLCSIFSVWIKRFLFELYIFRTPAKKNSCGEKCRPYVSFEKPDVEKQPLKVFYKKDFLNVSQNSQKNTRVGVSFLIKLLVSGYNFIEKDSTTQVLFCEFCEKDLTNFFYKVYPGDCFWMFLLFFDFRFVLCYTIM